MTRQESIGIAAGLVATNILVMYGLAATPVAGMAAVLFDTLILGVLVFGAVLTGGVYIARRGVKDGNTGMAVVGTVLLQLGYGAFGGMVLALLPAGTRLTAATVTAVVTVAIAAGAAVYAFRTERDPRLFDRWATYCFLGVLVMAFIGTLSAPLAIVAFVLALAGFLLYLVSELVALDRRPGRVWMNAIGIYTAFMGVFIHILQIVVRMYAER